jgi:hypothetical protein
VLSVRVCSIHCSLPSDLSLSRLNIIDRALRTGATPPSHLPARPPFAPGPPPPPVRYPPTVHTRCTASKGPLPSWQVGIIENDANCGSVGLQRICALHDAASLCAQASPDAHTVLPLPLAWPHFWDTTGSQNNRFEYFASPKMLHMNI